MNKNVIVALFVTMIAGASMLQAQTVKEDSFAKTQIEKMKEFKKHRLSCK